MWNEWNCPTLWNEEQEVFKTEHLQQQSSNQEISSPPHKPPSSKAVSRGPLAFGHRRSCLESIVIHGFWKCRTRVGA